MAWRERWKKPRWTSVRTISVRPRFESGTSRLHLEQISWSTVRLTTALTRRVCSYCWINWLMKWLVSGLLQAAKTRVCGNPTSRGIELQPPECEFTRTCQNDGAYGVEWIGCRPAASHSVTRCETPSRAAAAGMEGWEQPLQLLSSFTATSIGYTSEIDKWHSVLAATIRYDYLHTQVVAGMKILNCPHNKWLQGILLIAFIFTKR